MRTSISMLSTLLLLAACGQQGEKKNAVPSAVELSKSEIMELTTPKYMVTITTAEGKVITKTSDQGYSNLSNQEIAEIEIKTLEENNIQVLTGDNAAMENSTESFFFWGVNGSNYPAYNCYSNGYAASAYSVYYAPYYSYYYNGNRINRYAVYKAYRQGKRAGYTTGYSNGYDRGYRIGYQDALESVPVPPETGQPDDYSFCPAYYPGC